MTLQQLKYFIVIAESGSFGKAAQKLYISQPTMSSVVRELEKELDTEIFVRTPKGVLLTESGKELYRYAVDIIEKKDEILDHFKNAGREKRQSLSVSSEHYSFVVEVLTTMANEMSSDKYVLRLKETNMMSAIEDVAKMRSDIGVIYKAVYSEKDISRVLEQSSLEFIPMKKIKPHVFLHKSHPLAKREFLRYRDLKPYLQVNYSLDENIPMFFSEEINNSSHIPDRNIYTSDLFTSVSFLRECMAYDVGTGILSEDLKKEFTAIPLDSDEMITIGVLRHRSVPISAMSQKFIDLLGEKLNSDIS